MIGGEVTAVKASVKKWNCCLVRVSMTRPKSGFHYWILSQPSCFTDTDFNVSNEYL